MNDNSSRITFSAVVDFVRFFEPMTLWADNNRNSTKYGGIAYDIDPDSFRVISGKEVTPRDLSYRRFDSVVGTEVLATSISATKAFPIFGVPDMLKRNCGAWGISPDQFLPGYRATIVGLRWQNRNRRNGEDHYVFSPQGVYFTDNIRVPEDEDYFQILLAEDTREAYAKFARLK